MSLPVLGVGLSYFPGLDPLLGDNGDLVAVLEVEPQTLWFQVGREKPDYRIDEAALRRIASLGYPKIIHGIGFPVGGSRPPDDSQVPLLRRMIAELRAPWVSEHLSFNQAAGAAGRFSTGFLLPPRQTAAGIDAAVRSIRAMADQIPVPLAVETGVNYLRPRADELPDGVFVRAVVDAADCGLLLDLHNLWANQLNGRQLVDEFLDQIPLERVWEVHLAGGSEREGYWLDSHCGAVPPALLDLARRVIPRLPRLRALIFELFPTYLPVVGLDLVRQELEALHELWTLRREDVVPSRPSPPILVQMEEHDGTSPSPSPREWEDVLGALVVGQGSSGPLARELCVDPGVRIVNGLLNEFRSLMVVNVLKLSSRLIILMEGRAAFERLLAGYWQTAAPELFSSVEAVGFAEYLASERPAAPYLSEVLAFEQAVVATLIDRQPRVVPFTRDPLVVLRALAEGRLPVGPAEGAYEVEVTPDEAAPLGKLESLPPWMVPLQH